MKAAVCFWGLTRSLRKTFRSLQEKVLKPLADRYGEEVDVYMHTFSLRRPLTNDRSHEKECRIDPDEWKLLLGERVMVRLEDQDTVDQTLSLEAYRTFPDPWGTDYETADNHIRALYSLQEVTLMMDSTLIPYDVVVFCRPDLSFQTPLTGAMFAAVRAKTILLPDFHQFPVNDRFAITTHDVARVYGMRYHRALTYSRAHPLHSETFLSDILRSEQIRVVTIPVFFQRFRAGAAVPKEES